ncbi:hypothetical protein HYQ45_015082 [Verticillium longisporum]|uniref:Uncharacterized protein n=1 Tax=Verticillium longisporum TaxID=100787 RepID=A0A8I3AL53_VERLO|nr:hypothetical protein HYQ45_015082 [Verticillium longisporum]
MRWQIRFRRAPSHKACLSLTEEPSGRPVTSIVDQPTISNNRKKKKSALRMRKHDMKMQSQVRSCVWSIKPSLTLNHPPPPLVTPALNPDQGAKP